MHGCDFTQSRMPACKMAPKLHACDFTQPCMPACKMAQKSECDPFWHADMPKGLGRCAVSRIQHTPFPTCGHATGGKTVCGISDTPDLLSGMRACNRRKDGVRYLENRISSARPTRALHVRKGQRASGQHREEDADPYGKNILAQTASPKNFKMNESDHSDTRLTIFVQKREMAKKTPTLTEKIFLGKQHLLKI